MTLVYWFFTITLVLPSFGGPDPARPVPVELRVRTGDQASCKAALRAMVRLFDGIHSHAIFSECGQLTLPVEGP